MKKSSKLIAQSANFRALRPDKIIDTQRRLRERIAKRFPSSGLSGVANELRTVAEAAAIRAEFIRRPNYPLRIGVGLLLAATACIAFTMIRSLHLHADLWEISNLVQFTEAGLGSIVFLGVSILFLLSLELRLKRRRALAALHELRAIAHVVDMHQLAKAPEGLLHLGPTLSQATEQTTRTPYDLNRYLNYCNELLAIISKVAALYVQDFPDADAVDAVDQIESLCSGLSNKIWQKIMVLERLADDPHGASVESVPAASP